MVKSYKGVKSGRGCEGITVSRRCAAEGASIFGQASPRVVVDGIHPTSESNSEGSPASTTAEAPFRLRA